MNKYCFGVGIMCVSSLAWAAVTVTPVQVMEMRQKDLVPQAGMQMGPTNALTVKVKLDGPELKNATQYGKVKITEASDDMGTSLLPRENMAFMGQAANGFQPFRSHSESSMGFDKPAAPALNHEVELNLGVPSRGAKKIKAVRGELQVLVGSGQPTAVQVRNLPAMSGKDVTDPALKQAGVVVKILDKKAANSMSPDMPMMGNMGNGPSVSVQISGNPSAIESMDVVDATGRSLSSGSFDMTMGDIATKTIQLSRPLSAAMVLKLNVSVGQKPITVPFDLQDIELP